MIAFGAAGLIIGLFFGFIYGIVYLITGGMPRPDGSIISPWSAAVMYVVTCGLGGALVGALRSRLHSRPGSAVVGIIGMIPIFWGSAVLYEGSLEIDWWVAVLGPIVVGIPIGLAIRKEYLEFLDLTKPRRDQ